MHNGTTIGGVPKPHNIRKLRKHNQNHADNGNCTPRRNVLPMLCPHFAHVVPTFCPQFGPNGTNCAPDSGVAATTYGTQPIQPCTQLAAPHHTRSITLTRRRTPHEHLCAQSETHSQINPANDGAIPPVRTLTECQDARIHKDRNVVIPRLVTQSFRKVTVKSAFRSRSRSAGRVYS